MRRPIIAGNWKMYKDPAQTSRFFEHFIPLVAQTAHCEIVVFPPFVNIEAAVRAVHGTRIEIGGQNLYWEQEGAYTGEVSGHMLHAAGCRWALVAHSERRKYFGETDATAHQRIRAALHAKLHPVLCVGEVLEERVAGQTEAVLQKQFIGAAGALEPEQFARLTIAYEPVWAIGTGKTATPQMAADAHAFIRKLADQQFGAEAAKACRILYGGSVKPENIHRLMAEEQIDGALVGGASLEPKSFAALVNYGASISQ